MITREPSTTARWSSPEWIVEMRAWVTDALADHGVKVTGPLERLKQRPWSVVLSVPTSEGPFYAKQNCPGQNFEAGLLSVLAELVPDHVVAPVAVDAERGFLLTPDGGPLLAGSGGSDVDTWCRVVARWAEVQRSLVGSVQRLVDAGVTMVPTAAMPLLVESRGEALHSLPEDDPRRLDDERHAALIGVLDSVRASADRLGAVGLPPTLNHNDLHEHNVFASSMHGRLRFFDLGDSVGSDPLMVLRVPLNVLGHELGADLDDPRLVRVVEAFLEVWSDVAPLPRLRSVVPDALRLGRICRHESWWRVLPCLDDAELVEYGELAGFWLASMSEDPA